MIKRTTQINTYAYLFESAKLALDKVEGDDPFHNNNYKHLIVYYTFQALTVEAFINHVGLETFDWWEESEKGMSIKAKMRILLHNYNIKYDSSIEPFQTINDLIRFRNQIVHGKTQIIKQELNDNKPSDRKEKLSDWGKFISKKNPLKTYKCVEDFANMLWVFMKKSKQFPYPFGLVSSSEEW